MLRDIGERRNSARHAISRIDKNSIRHGTRPRDCLITDVSDGGVRLHAEGLEVPQQFTLWFSGGTLEPRECNVVWRLGYEIGAEFIDTPLEGFCAPDGERAAARIALKQASPGWAERSPGSRLGRSAVPATCCV